MNIEALIEKAIKVIPQTRKRLGEGEDGIVYAIDNKVVLKIFAAKEFFYRGSSRKDAEYEFEIGKELYAQGVQVPEYFSLFKLDYYWGVFMERIHGIKPGTFYFNLLGLRKEAERQYKEQRKLVDRLGYYMFDSYCNHNTLFDRTKNKLYLYDLLRWKRKF